MITALVAAAGTGERLGAALPKALVELRGRPLVAWCLAALQESSRIEAVIAAAPPGFEDQIATVALDSAPRLATVVVTGGESRSRSVANALEAAVDASVALVHDAARPLVTAQLIDACVEHLEQWGCDGVVAAAPVTDTIKMADADGRVSATLERDGLWAVQTPQAFRPEALRDALRSGSIDDASDDAQLVEAAGGEVRILDAPRKNLKITSQLDLHIATSLLGAH